MLDALDADEGISHLSDLGSLAFYDQDFQTVLMIEMHVHTRHDMSLEVVLDVGELPGEVPHMMVVDERDRRHRLTVRLTTPFLIHELITDEIAKRFRTCEVFPTPDDLIEVVQEMVVQ